MMIRLWVSETSPYARKARLALRELGLLERVQEYFVKTTPMTTPEEVSKQNPLGKIPFLTGAEDYAIFDSDVICRYFDEKMAGGLGKLHPKNDYKHETLMALADGMLDTAIVMVYEKNMRPEEKQFPEWVDAQWRKIEKALVAIEENYFDYFSDCQMGVLTVFSALEYFDLRFASRNWRDYAPKLASWHQQVADYPHFVATRPPK